MTISDRLEETQDAQGSVGSSLVKSSPLLLAMLTLWAQSGTHVPAAAGRVLQPQTSSSIAPSTAAVVEGRDIFLQIHRVYDELLRNQVELDADAKRALYENLWDLYT